MACDIPKVQLYLYLDGELDQQEALTIEEHVYACEICQVEVAAHQRLQLLLRSTFPTEEVPSELWPAIQARLPAEDGAELSFWHRFKGRTAYVTTGLAAAVLIGLIVGVQMWLAAPVSQVVQEIVDSQIRAQLMDMPYKKISPEAGAVRRWFQDKVAFSVLVPNMPDDNYVFHGVRLNYFLNRRVVEIAYDSSHHMLSFLMFAGQDISLKSARAVHNGERTFFVQTYKGYNTVLWRDGDYFCSVVSDLHMTALLDIARVAATQT